MQTEIKVERFKFSEKSTIGKFFMDGASQCFTLEDKVRDLGQKIPHLTAIPAGRYEVILSFSNKFGAYLPELLNVPNFTSIRIHCGNRPSDTDGCILLGSNYGPDAVYESRAAFKKIFPTLKTCYEKGKVFLTIYNTPVEDTRESRF